MNFPESFVQRMSRQLGEEADDFFKALADKPSVSIRFNPAKPIPARESFTSAVPWCNTGVYLDSRPKFTLDPLFHAGCYYVQEPSSMFLEQIFLQLNLGEKQLLVLDACAAPGGKTTHLASLISNDSLLVSNEVINSRVPSLTENVIKWGTGNVVITNNDPAAFSKLHGLFDLIVVDAPCSGEGLFRRHPEAVREWNDDNCSLCTSRQQRILTNLLPALKQDGILVYCTCTYNPRENENNIQWMCDNFGMEPIKLISDFGMRISEMGAAFYPHRIKGEGFFISVLRKRQEAASIHISKHHKAFSSLSNKFSFVKDWLVSKDGYEIIIHDHQLYLLPSFYLPLLDVLQKNLKVIYSGTALAEIKGDSLIPNHSLAMSTSLNKNAFLKAELTKEDALNYLRKAGLKPITEDDKAKKGWTLATFESVPLGWLNNLGNRYNNYYPGAWRIVMR